MIFDGGVTDSGLTQQQFKHHDDAGHAFGKLMGRIQRIFDVEVGANIIQYGDEDFRLEDFTLGVKDGVRMAPFAFVLENIS